MSEETKGYRIWGASSAVRLTLVALGLLAAVAAAIDDFANASSLAGPRISRQERAADSGDFADLLAQPCAVMCSPSMTALRRAVAAARLHDPELAKRLIAQAGIAETMNKTELVRTHAEAGDKVEFQLARYYLDASLGDWDAAADAARKLSDSIMADEDFDIRTRTLQALDLALPLLADALAHGDDVRGARGIVYGTPADCYDCQRVRGEIDALDKNWRDANYWFGHATAQAPSLPFAYTDWGEILLRQGRFDAAIEKLEKANSNGPHFADPLELWGEALVQEKRSDLALAKFEEANKYAPNWGRLHLEWGEALFYAGKKDEAGKQFAIASTLDLSAEDKAQLARMGAPHG